MIDRETLINTLNHVLHIPAKEIDLKKLPGDASNRTYYRLSWKGNHPFHSFILMVLANPEGFKASEEAVSDALPPMIEIPFINIQKHLLGCKVPVPEIVFSNTSAGWLLLEDLGDETLAQRIKDQIQNKPLLLSFYRKAIDELITLQLEATPAPTSPTIAHYRRFDQSLFVWEFDHFIEYGIEKRKGIRLGKKGKNAIRTYFSDIAFRLAQLPPVFTHRDYHSRNLMIQSGPAGFKIRVIDFQDALMGPSQYDLASLLRDSYIDLHEEVIDALILYYIESWEKRTRQPVGRERFRELFDLASIQRNLKAVGRFAYIDQVKKNSRFLPYIPPTLAKVKLNLLKNKRLSHLYSLLIRYVEELR